MLTRVSVAVTWFCVSVLEGAQVTQPEVVVASRHGEATLVCGYKVRRKAEEMHSSLLRKTKNHMAKICSFSYTDDYEPATSGQVIRCLGVPGPDNVTYHISGLQAEDTGLYVCKLEVMYPPPYRVIEGSATFIYVGGAQVTQPEVVVASRHGEATLVCGYKVRRKAEEMHSSLLRKTKNHMAKICSFSYTDDYEPATSGQVIRCLGVPGPDNVTYHISGLQAVDTGLYVCKLEVMYPPPYRVIEGNATFIYVGDLSSQCAQSMEPAERQTYEWVLLSVFLLMLLYSLFVTCVLLLKHRKKRWETGCYEQMLQSNSKTSYPYYIPV
ncbi:cytotoxic T-lymphocyte protein 4 [Pseudophryne corroboree]|uniref:cytotoxic T-lymphocyte protein 4 n=1 Tax=Pseudophryne corroboree TaxID=495146 RepID=UPI0030815971